MLLERLREYAEVQLGDSLPPPGYQLQPIRYTILLRRDGTYEGFLDNQSPDAPRGTPRLAPHAKRAMGIVPKLMADTGEYVLGIPRVDPKKPPKPERVADQHRQFRDLVDDCARQTSEPSVEAISRFLEDRPPIDLEESAGFDASSTITFRVEGVYPVDLDPVRRYWAQRRAPDKPAGDVGEIATCIVCGERRPVLERHPLKIKGIPGGQILKDLISANSNAYESYGQPASTVAPTCATCAEAYGNALNALLASRSTSVWAGGLAYAFWTEPKARSAFAPIAPMTQPDVNSGEVRALLQSFWSYQRGEPIIDDTRFYAAAFGASGARAVVKDWIDTTVGSAKASLGRYFALQEIVEWNGAQGDFLPLNWIAGSTVRRKETPPAIVIQSLVRLALAGTPLPMDLLYLAVRRSRAEQDVTRARAALIKMVLQAGASSTELQENTMAKLDVQRDDPPYVCGRLLATVDRIQRQALGSTNSTVIDKFYGSASSAPASVFGTLLDGVQPHLNKLRKERPGAYVNLDRQLQDVLDLLADFPTTLNLKQQGLFALGFYHQRAFDRATADANRAARSTSGEEQDPATATPDE